jgi:hypothetical protein
MEGDIDKFIEELALRSESERLSVAPVDDD